MTSNESFVGYHEQVKDTHRNVPHTYIHTKTHTYTHTYIYIYTTSEKPVNDQSYRVLDRYGITIPYK
jgi:hypothetical protein